MSKPNSPLAQADIAKLTCSPHRKSFEATVDAIKVPGLFVEIRHTGGMTYYLRYRDAENRTRYAKIGRTMDISLTDAKKAALKLRAGILLGNYPGADKREQRHCMTFTEFFEQKYLPFAKPRKRSWRDDEKLYNRRLKALFGALPLDGITLEATERFLGELVEEGLAASSVRHHGQLLKRCTSLAVKWQVLDTDPLSDLKLQQVNDAREYFLSDEELQRLLHVLDTDSARVPCLAAKALLFTGCRVGEMLKCRWNDLSLESDAPTLKVIQENSKNGRARYVPLSDAALEVINQLPSKDTSEYLFTNSRNGERLQSIDKAWQRLRKDAGLPQLRLHDLRHNFASMLVNSGESLYTVQKILGHQDPALSARYSHLSGTALQDAANSVTSYLDKALNKKGSTGK
jgi:integrase